MYLGEPRLLPYGIIAEPFCIVQGHLSSEHRNRHTDHHRHGARQADMKGAIRSARAATAPASLCCRWSGGGQGTNTTCDRAVVLKLCVRTTVSTTCPQDVVRHESHRGCCRSQLDSGGLERVEGVASRRGIDRSLVAMIINKTSEGEPCNGTHPTIPKPQCVGDLQKK